MKEGVLVRFLIPSRCDDGTITYRVETRHIRLPLKRDDRRELSERLRSD
jgi:hypothetical protein